MEENNSDEETHPRSRTASAAWREMTRRGLGRWTNNGPVRGAPGRSVRVGGQPAAPAASATSIT